MYMDAKKHAPSRAHSPGPGAFPTIPVVLGQQVLVIKAELVRPLIRGALIAGDEVALEGKRVVPELSDVRETQRVHVARLRRAKRVVKEEVSMMLEMEAELRVASDVACGSFGLITC